MWDQEIIEYSNKILDKTTGLYSSVIFLRTTRGCPMQKQKQQTTLKPNKYRKEIKESLHAPLIIGPKRKDPPN